MFNEIIIHIGMHKTGTTTIQKAFHKNKNILENQAGILYPFDKPNHSEPLFSMFCENPEFYYINVKRNIISRREAEELNKNYFNILENEILNTSAKRLLVSGEDLSRLSENGVRRLKEYLSCYGKYFKIIAWLREPVQLASSKVQHSIKSGNYKLKKVWEKPPFSNYKQRLEKYVDIFGIGKIELVDFDEAIEHPQGIIGKFCDQIELKDLRSHLLSVPKENESISYEAVLLIDKINEKMPLITDNQITPGRWNGDIEPFTRIKGKNFTLDKSVLERIEEKDKEDLEWLKETFGFEFCDRKEAIESSQDGLFNEDSISSIAHTFFEEIQLLNAKLFIEKGKHALTKKEYSKAVEYFKSAVTRKPDLPETHYYLSISLKHVGRINEVLEEAKRAVDLKPGSQQFQKHYNKLLSEAP